MSNLMNQEWALAQWRADASKNDPAFYSTKKMLGSVFIWMNIGGNIGWYRPEIKDGELLGIRSISIPQPSDDETEESYRVLNYAFKLVSPKQREKIKQAILGFGSDV